MGWLQERTAGVRNTTVAGVAAVGLGAAAFLALQSGRSSPPSPAAPAATAATRPSVELAPSPSSSPSSPPSEPDAPKAAALTVALSLLGTSDDYKGKDVCTCGFVHSSGSSRAVGIDHVRRSVLNNVFVTEAPTTSAVDGGGAHAICTWMGAEAPNVKVDDPVCVRGQYIGPAMRRCAVVPSCP